MKRETRELLDRCLFAFNQIENTPIYDGKGTMTKDMTREIRIHLVEEDNRSTPFNLPDTMFYLQFGEKHDGIMLWQGPDGNYTDKIREAVSYNQDELEAMIDLNPSLKPWPVNYINRRKTGKIVLRANVKDITDEIDFSMTENQKTGVN